jgi:hypothetical protein
LSFSSNVIVSSILSKVFLQRSLRIALLILLLLTILSTIASAWAVYNNTHWDEDFDFYALEEYISGENVFEALLQTGVFVALLYVPSSSKSDRPMRAGV